MEIKNKNLLREVVKSMGEPEAILKILEKSPVFENCDIKSLSQFVAQSNIISFEKGQILFVHEEPAKRFFMVLSGWIKLFRETLDGSQAIIDILPAGHLFGETSVFNDNSYPYSAEAVEQTKLISIPLNLLKSEIDANPKMVSAMLYNMAKVKRQQDLELEHLVVQNAPQRIGCFLLRLTNQSQEAAVKIQLPYDKSLVAARLGMQPETFSRALTKLKDATGLEINGSTISLSNVRQLIEFSCAACSSEFPCKDLGSKASCPTH
jgi:CRP-like cAMP-binding protein